MNTTLNSHTLQKFITLFESFHSLVFWGMLLSLNQLIEIFFFFLNDGSALHYPILEITFPILLFLVEYYANSKNIFAKSKIFLKIILLINILLGVETSFILNESEGKEVFFLKGMMIMKFLFNFNEYGLVDHKNSLLLTFSLFGYLLVRFYFLIGKIGFIVAFFYLLNIFEEIQKKNAFVILFKNSFLGPYEQLNQEKVHFQNILQNLPIGIISMKNESILFQNPQFNSLLAVSSRYYQELKKELCTYVVFDDYLDKIKKKLKIKLPNPKSMEKFISKMNIFQKSQTNIHAPINSLIKTLEQPDINSKNQEDLSTFLEYYITKNGKMSITIDKSADVLFNANAKQSKKSKASKASTISFLKCKTKKAISFLKKIKTIFNCPWPSRSPSSKSKLTLENIVRDQPTIKNIYICKKCEKEENFRPLKVSLIYFEEDNSFFLTVMEIPETNEIKEHLFEMKKTQSKIIASLAHELKTPLSGMSPLFETLKDQIEIEISRQTLNPLIANFHILNLIVSDYLDFSKIYLGDFQLNYSLFNLHELIEKILNFLLITKRNNKLDVEVDVDPEIQEIIKTDQKRVSQILHNLIANAFKFTPSGSIKISAKHLKNILFQNIIEISVEDTGCGINKNLLKRLGTLNSNNEKKLAGMGLTISNYIAGKLAPRNLSGIFVNSKEGKGSKFFFLIENINDEKSDNSSISIESMKKSSSIEPLHVIANDDPSPKFALGEKKTTFIMKKPQTIEELDEKSRNGHENHSYSHSNLDFQSNEMFHLPIETNKYLEKILFKNKFLKKSPKHFSSTPQIFSFENPINITFSGFCKNNHKPPTNSLTPPPVANLLKLQSSPRFESGEQLLSSFGESLQKDNNIEILIKKVQEKKCFCPDILVVDDHPYNGDFFKMIATNLPFKLAIDYVDRGEKALSKIKEFYENSVCNLELKCFSYKCIFMDYDMPNKNGVETMREINEYFRDKNFIPTVIAWTAFDDKSLKKECKDSGMVGYLSKPFNINDLKSILIKHVLPQFI